MSDQTKSERERLNVVYAKYASSARSQRIWDDRNEGNKSIRRERIEAMRSMLTSLSIQPSALTSVVEVGCGDGKFAGELSDVGIPITSIVGVEINASRLKAASTRITALLGDGAELPIRANTIELVVLSTVLSSINASGVRAGVLEEAAHALRPGGVLLVYDLRLPSPANRAVSRVPKRSLAAGFEGWEHRVRSLTVLPPLARRLGRSSGVYSVLGRIGPLRSHRLDLLRKPGAYSAA